MQTLKDTHIMATKTVPATEVATLREALLDADMRCQAAEEEIEAL